MIGATPRYLAPEYRGAGAGSDARARDLWALGLTLAELADARVAESDNPAERVRTCQLDARLEPLVRPLLRAAAGARPSAEWVHRQAASALGNDDLPERRRQRGAAALRRAYLSTRRPWLERVANGDVLELRVTGLAEQWLGRAAAIMADVARVRGGSGAPSERRRHVVEDLATLDQQRLLLRLIGPAEQALGALDRGDGCRAARAARALDRRTDAEARRGSGALTRRPARPGRSTPTIPSRSRSR